jgi:hypothetical protein
MASVLAATARPFFQAVTPAILGWFWRVYGLSCRPRETSQKRTLVNGSIGSEADL